MKKILLVDDELQILKALSRMFLDTDYEIITTQNSPDVMQLIESENIDMIISDMRMPVLDGYQLLSMVKEKYPKIIRIMISGYADEKPMFRAILHNVAHLHVYKPWNNDELLHNISKLFTDDTLLNSEELIKRIDTMGCCFAIPGNCDKMISLIKEEDIDSLIAVMDQDPIISKLLLQVAKSAVYGVMPNAVKQTSIYIGLHNLKCFLRFACVVSSQKKNTPETEPELLLKQAYYTNRIFLFLYEVFLHKQPPDSTMFAGLLHNIGLFILSQSKEDNVTLKNIDITSEDYVKFELGEYKLNHQEIGAYFLDLWDLPFPIYEVALYHHRPLDENIIHRELVCCVHIAQYYAWKTLGVPEQEPLLDEVFDRIDTSREDFEKRLARYLK